MKKLTIFVLILGFLGGGAYFIYSKYAFPPIEEKTTEQEIEELLEKIEEKEASKDSAKTGLVNPASVYCEEQGGRLEIRTSGEGEIGYCIFENGLECEEWAFFRKECDQMANTDNEEPKINDAEKTKETENPEEQNKKNEIISDTTNTVDITNWNFMERPSDNFSFMYPRGWYYVIKHSEASLLGLNKIIGLSASSSIWEDTVPFDVQIMIHDNTDKPTFTKPIASIAKNNSNSTYIIATYQEEYRETIKAIANSIIFLNQ